jgi:NAD-dependent deacetylase
MIPERIFPDELIQELRIARSVAVLTGAGISAESGLATFRDPMTGLWAKYRPEDLATPEAFSRNPKLVWEWYAMRREQAQQAKPNPAHYALVELESRVPDFTLITQNVDNLHRVAGSRNLLELHGNIFRFKCFTEDLEIGSWKDNGESPPRCPRCGGMVRPDIVWFGEMLPVEAYREAQQAARRSEVFFSIGTSGVVQPAAGLPHFASENDATVITINLEVQEIARPGLYGFNGKAGEILPALLRKVWL